MVLFHDTAKRQCAFCGASFRPERSTQKYCRYWCYQNARAAEGRAMRRVWWREGRPSEAEIDQRKERQA
jgi:hypothetical protein